MAVKVKTGFTSLSDAELAKQAGKIVTEMTKFHDDYPSPTPALDDVANKRKAFNDLVVAVRTPAMTEAKNKLRRDLIDLMNDLALYVKQQCKNDSDKALRSGYKIWKTRTPVGTLPKPSDMKVEAGYNSGEIFVSMKSFGSIAKSYVFRLSQVEGSEPEAWVSYPSTKASLLIKKLISGKKVSVQGAGVGSNGELVWSDIITVYVM